MGAEAEKPVVVHACFSYLRDGHDALAVRSELIRRSGVVRPDDDPVSLFPLQCLPLCFRGTVPNPTHIRTHATVVITNVVAHFHSIGGIASVQNSNPRTKIDLITEREHVISIDGGGERPVVWIIDFAHVLSVIVAVAPSRDDLRWINEYSKGIVAQNHGLRLRARVGPLFVVAKKRRTNGKYGSKSNDQGNASCPTRAVRTSVMVRVPAPMVS